MRVEAKSLRKSFGRVHALRGVDFSIASGERVGLIGPNASGKSTLIRIILGLLHFEGELLLDGEPRRGIAQSAAIAYVPQIAPKLGASVGEVVRAITRVRDLEPAEVTARGADVGIDLPAVDEQAFRNLSGGAKQKTLLALALASRASLYVLDEPTASLDTQSRRDLFRLLSERTNGSTLVLCSHRLEEIRTLVDRVMVLEEGRLAYFGPTEEYLDRMTLSTIEVQMTDGAHADVLLNLGFEPGVAGWWRRTATRSEKLEVVADLARHLGHRVSNVLVRDADAVPLGDSAEKVDVEGRG